MSRQYMNASKAVTAITTQSGSLKSYCNRNKVGKTDYALICETLKYIDVMEALFGMSAINAETLDVNKGALFVYCYELLFGAGKIQGGGAVKRRLLEHESSLRESLSKYQVIRGVSSHQDLIDSHFTEHSQMPVYVRINTLKPGSVDGLSDIKCIHPEAALDKHIPHLVVLPAGTKRTGELDRVKNSDWIIQDKASCMPSQILADVWDGGDLIDACAAPGNKTSHLAALVMESGRGDHVKLYAFDKSEVRWKLLRDRMLKASAVNVLPTNADFLEVDTNDPLFSNVTAVLVDPSCSGSGVVRAIDRVYERVKNGSVNQTDEISEERLTQLRAFQIKAILQAMSFPKVKHVVYSTCSVNKAENEDVVAEILQQKEDWVLVNPWRFSTWTRRGIPTPELSSIDINSLIRCTPADGANGFFVALFKRKEVATTPVVSDIGINISSSSGTCLPVNQQNNSKKRIGGSQRWRHLSKRFKY